MTTCNQTWVERYVTATKNVSIQRTHHRCELVEGHASKDRSHEIPRCQCRCGAVPPMVRSRG